MTILKNDWSLYLEEQFQKPYYQELRNFLREEYKTQQIYPNMQNIFNALHYTSYANTKVVIIGQDPYHGPNQAHGLSFSVQPGIESPPSLKNIFKELKNDLGYPMPQSGSLVKWAEQGVLLLNSVLTVQAGKPNSHQGKGWEIFTDQVISTLDEREKPVIFLLWGKNAQEKQRLITNSRHYKILAPHPSPLSAYRGFFDSKPFSQANGYLRANGLKEIDWRL